jgi:hypothetical protein
VSDADERMLTYAYATRRRETRALRQVRMRMLAYADACVRMLRMLLGGERRERFVRFVR